MISKERDDDVVVSALQEHLTFEGDHFPLLRSLEGADEALELLPVCPKRTAN